MRQFWGDGRQTGQLAKHPDYAQNPLLGLAGVKECKTPGFANHLRDSSGEGGFFLLLQLRVLRFGFFQDGNIWVGVFPER